MNWINFKDKLPEDRQIILQWNAQEAYIGDVKVMSKMVDAPYITRFIKEDWEAQSREGKEPDMSFSGIDMYQFMQCWIPVPELDEVYTKDDFQMSEEEMQALKAKMDSQKH